MRLLLAAALGLAACATASPAPTAQQSCAPTTAPAGTMVYSAPDQASDLVTRLERNSQVCADSASVGFGYRHVKLANGQEGYVADGDLI
jgi:hypothetical protein